MSNIFHIKPIYKEFIWGGRKLIDYFHLPQSLEQIGTIYHVIAVPGHLDNLVEETGEPLSVFYQTNPALFRCNRKDLPIRMTTTCNEGRQSYQLHPTYRFFDYGRNDPKRPLEIDKVIECANIPELPLGAVHIEPVTDDGLRIWTYYDTPGEYTARRIEVCGQGCYESDPFYFVSCVAGEGSVGGLPLQLGETLLVPAAAGPLSLCGSMTLIQISYKD